MLQREDKVRRDHIRSSPDRPKAQASYELLCGKCKTFACLSEDLRVVQVRQKQSEDSCVSLIMSETCHHVTGVLEMCHVFLLCSLQASHHIVLDHSIFKRCTTQPHKKPKTFDGICKKEKLLCATCKYDWGIIVSYLNIQVTHTNSSHPLAFFCLV